METSGAPTDRGDTTVSPERGDPVGEQAEHRHGLTPVTLLLILILAYVLYKVQVVVILLLVAILLATAISRPTEFLHRRFRLRRGAAIALIYLGLLALLGGGVAVLVPAVASEGADFVRAIPKLVATWHTRLASSDNALIRAVAERAFDAIAGVVEDGNIPVPPSLALGLVSGLGGTLVALFTVLLIAFYWLIERVAIERAVVAFFRPDLRPRVGYLWREIEEQLGAWLRGEIVLMAVIGGMATAAYGLLQLPFWLVLGVFAGLTEAIPNVGPVLGAVPAVLIALTVDWKLALAVVAFVTVLQLTENAILVPRIMHGAVGLSPLIVILAILAGSEIGGVGGAVLAVPLAAIVAVVLADARGEVRGTSDERHRRSPLRCLRVARRRQRGLQGRTPPGGARLPARPSAPWWPPRW